MIITFVLFQSVACAYVDPNTEKESRISPDEQLSKALEALDPNAVKAALEAGANPNLTFNNDNFSALGRATLEADSFNSRLNKEKKEEICLIVLNTLFNAGAKMQRCDKSILIFPIADGFPKVVELLIDKGANPNAKMEGMTPVEWAEAYEQKPVVEVLLKYGAKPISKEHAAQNRFVRLARESYKNKEYFEQRNIVDMEKALKDGATINGKNSKGDIALVESIDCAYKVENYITVIYLLQKGANSNLKSERQHFSELAGIPLHHAVAFHGIMAKNGEDRTIYQKLIIEALLNAGAHVSSRGYKGMTPLHIAAKNNDTYMTNLLIEAGAKIMDRDDFGKTPLDYAESAEMIKLLKSHGAKEL